MTMNSENVVLNAFTDIYYQAEYAMPFAGYIKPPAKSQTVATSISFDQFLYLPFEIRQLICQACDLSTLFTMTHTSPAIRGDALQAFWSNRNPWYQTASQWLVTGKGYAGCEAHCPRFALQVQQVEVNFERVESGFMFELDESLLGSDSEMSTTLIRKKNSILEEQAHKFWEALKRNFPAARYVVLTESVSRNTEDPLPKMHIILLQKCPPTIRAYASLLQYTRIDEPANTHRNLCSLSVEHDKEFSLVTVAKDWTRDRIILPPRQFHGPIGEFQQACRREFRLSNHLIKALRYARLSAYENSVFGPGGPQSLTCPRPRCTAHFSRAGEWTQHALSTRHDQSVRIRLVQPRPSRHFHRSPRVTDAVERWLEEAESRIQERAAEEDALQSEWRSRLRDETRRDAYVAAFLKQLENDPLYQQGCAAECSLLYDALMYHMAADGA